MSEISKAYEPQSVEDKWYQFWLDQKCFVADAQSLKPAYSIVIPPPNVTGVLTMGHVLNNTIQDILARKARMDGKEVLWLPGTDHAGIATQTVVERTLKKSGEIKHRDDLGREKFLERVWQWKEKHGGIIIQQLKKLGASCDWTRERFTMDPEYSRCVQKVFVELYKKGLIYRGKRMVNWCPVSLTALSDEEVVMKEQKGSLYYFKVQVAESPLTPSLSPDGGEGEKIPATRAPSSFSPTGGEGQDEGDKFGPVTDSEGRVWLTIATTRPETIPGDTAVAVNPKDPRYAKFIGKHVIRPLPAELPREQKLIPIIGDEHVDFEFGTGVLKVTPAHDKADFEIGQRHKLAQIDIMHPNGHMNELAGKDLNGLDRFKARKVATEKLAELGALEKEEPYTNNVGFSERADVPIEPRLSEQWFLKYPSVEPSKACVAQDGYKVAASLPAKTARVVKATGKEILGRTIHELRKAALVYARKHGIIGVPFKNEDSGMEIRVGRQSLSHAFSHIGVANILAVAVLPELIRTAVWISSEPHEPRNPMVKLVHRFVAALSLEGELHSVLITAKEFYDGTVLYDHKTKKITLGGKSLEARPREGKLDTQPAPSAGVKLGDLLAGVNVEKMRFHPDRWAKVYDHWMGGLQDWCISRQLWWGHRIPVWSKGYADRLAAVNDEDEIDRLVRNRKDFVVRREPEVKFAEDNDKPCKVFVCVAPDSSADSDQANLIKQIEALGFTQDPDVLDTWFSSWLWPFATMGWPEQTATLKKFYPTTDLVTGPDIIFFWVARMIMAGYEFMGEPRFGLPDAMPFKNVYFTGIIRDKQGRKMSKSLGNSPDPLDLIGKYGADALRFGTMRSAPLGQDILFDEQNVELGRNFCNKLWNACRFRQLVGQASSLSPISSPQGGISEKSETGATPVLRYEVQGEIVPQLLTSDDKWILLKLDAAIREMNTAFAEYKFSDATATLYRFFWSEYCDWYVEASKAALSGSSRRESAPSESQSGLTSAATNDEAHKANTLAVIDFVLSHTLRLFHPFLPFITEELWHGMGYSTDMPENQGGKTIMFAPWPKPLDDDFKEHYGLTDAGEKLAEAKYELVSLGRNLRREFNIQANKKIKFIIKPAGQLSALDAEILKLLLNAESVEVKSEFAPPKGTPMVSNSLGELFLPLEGLVDVAAEKNRLTKEKEKIEAEIAKVKQKLNNPSFAQKVPANVLAEHQQRLADWQAKLAQVKSALAALG